MVAILNRQQELPRIRTGLYERASEVLPYQWDIEHKRLNLPMDAIQLREKREMLRAIARRCIHPTRLCTPKPSRLST